MVCSPNEDFGRPNKPFRVRFRSTLQGCEHLILATKLLKVLRKDASHLLFILPKSSFGEHKWALKTIACHAIHRLIGFYYHFVTSLCSQTKILETRKTFWTACLGTISRVWVLVLGDSYLKMAEKDGPKQPSATHPHFGQTCLFTNFPNISTTVRGSKFRRIREKAGLSKMGVSCWRLVQNAFRVSKIFVWGA